MALKYGGTNRLRANRVSPKSCATGKFTFQNVQRY